MIDNPVYKFYALSAVTTFLGSTSTVLGTSGIIHAVRSVGSAKATGLYVNRDAAGQLIGMGLALGGARNVGIDDLFRVGATALVLQNSASAIETLLTRSSRFMALSCTASALRNAAWVGIGAVNVKLLSVQNRDLTTVYTELAVVNTIASTLGMYAGTKLLSLSRMTCSPSTVVAALTAAQLVSFYFTCESVPRQNSV
jgi:hypothetical protein